MLQGRLLRCSLLIALGTMGVWAHEDVVNVGRSPASCGDGACVREVNRVVAEREDVIERFILEGLPPDSTRAPKEQAAPALTTPQPTLPPRKRQDDGQIQALSEQLRQVSESATRALSSVSSSASSAISLVTQSAESVRQSADQAVRLASQDADRVSQQLSQTQSSAASAVSAANSRASEQMARSLESISNRIASAQSSASSAISLAQAEARSSASNALNIAASQIQAARADASGVRGDGNSTVTQPQSDSISGTSVAIIVTVAVVGTAILTVIAACFIVRYRRKRKRNREGLTSAMSINEKQYQKPVAVRGTPDSPRFTPFGGGRGYPMDNFKLPDLSLSPFLRKKIIADSQSDIGYAKSDYSVKEARRPSNASGADANGVSPTGFRLQKDRSIRSATSVRLIRVSSNKGKAKEDDQEDLPSPVAYSPPPIPVQLQPPEPPSSVRPPPLPVSEPEPAVTRSSRISEPNQPTSSPPKRTTMTNQQRLRFRDSSDVESAEPTPTLPSPTTVTTSLRNTNTASLRAVSGTGEQPPLRRPKNAGASFATFPRIRNPPPGGSAAEAILNRGRTSLSGVAARLQDEAERRRRELAAFSMGGGAGGRASQSGKGKGASADDKPAARPNWPFGEGRE
ncbi:hypothetical protein GGS23DRAFT_567130 [Durotheca rogersii]|uniref:uncharacterized protein n=1 Tax=Durotheca rogersii TaxID=419775 RepID=UPI00221E39F0|nr:uncharacterized protein GGS23DRAFT_567130 [Durotheca rogersii]KAI5863457.1 hypothetical protein GGS23DRAFT_567130 [Durotheca rogersii]